MQVIRNEPIFISLTGENSHKFTIPTGQGSFSIGEKGVSEGKYDVWVEKESTINWHAFNGLYTPHGKQNTDKYPYGDWPRFFYYSGNDLGFIDWSLKRQIESFHWIPSKNMSINLVNANIHSFCLQTQTTKVDLSIGNNIRTLVISGDPTCINIPKCMTVPALQFTFSDVIKATRPYELPKYPSLIKATAIDIHVAVIGQPFDCTCLLQFPELTHLNLSGNMINLNKLAELKHLKNIGLRLIPNLTDMPKLTTWQRLKSVIGWNIEETSGKMLKAELKALSSTKALDYSNVSKLRKAIWFMTEYGMPFSGWEDKSEKMAIKAYKTCLKDIKKLKTESEVQKAIIAFVDVFNHLPNIETSEREDIAVAVNQLVKSAGIDIPEEICHSWFDEARNF